jgi:demethylmenaquinone methyltransferase/2-methoxy-6-polyprenyl-1,4-benzoquinol methylase
MSTLRGEARTRYVRLLFGRIAARYDLLNRLMTFGRDRAWRAELVRRLGLPTAPRVLDLGAGTGDLALETLRQHPQARLVAADLTPQMMAVGRRRHIHAPDRLTAPTAVLAGGHQPGQQVVTRGDAAEHAPHVASSGFPA